MVCHWKLWWHNINELQIHIRFFSDIEQLQAFLFSPIETAYNEHLWTKIDFDSNSISHSEHRKNSLSM